MSRSRARPIPVRRRAEIEALAFGGAGIARLEGKVAFVPRALPGETVEIEVTGRRNRFDQARLVEVVAPSPHRRAPLCSHVSFCGGCSLQELDYAQQLAAKAAHVRDCLSRIGGLVVPELGPPIGSPRETRYRNKMEFTFARRGWEPEGPPETPGASPALGLHIPGRFDAVFDVDDCVLPSPRAVAVLHEVRRFAREAGLTAYRSREDEGLLRHLVVREGERTGELLVALVVREADAALERLGPLLAGAVEGLTGVVAIVNRTRATIAKGEEYAVLWGRPTFREILGGLSFELGAQSFFQTNTAGAEALVRALAEGLETARAGEGPRGSLLDLYCGAGTLGLCLASRFTRVTGVEQAAEAVRDAERAAARNGIGNAEFHVGDVERWIRDAAGPYEVVLVDPPRAGLHPRAVAAIPRLQAPVLAYVSCNPATLARDAAGFAEAGYRPIGLRIVDLFPQTGHIESILLFRREHAPAASPGLP